MRKILAAVLAASAIGPLAVAQERSAAAPPAKSVATPSPVAADAKSQPVGKTQAAAPRAADSNEPPDAPKLDVAKPAEFAINSTDIRDWRGLAKRLQVMGEAELQPNAAVWKSLPMGIQGAVKRLARDAKADPADQRVMLNALNAWLDDKNAAAAAGLKPENVRDGELQALLKKTDRSAEETRRLNRLLVDVMFPLELAAAPASVQPGKSTEIAKNDSGNVSRYPPNRQPEVTLSLTVPGLRGRVNVFLPGEKTLTFRGDGPVTIKVPNDGVLRYAVSGDEYDRPFPREVTWNPDDVKGGAIERALPLIKGPANR